MSNAMKGLVLMMYILSPANVIVGWLVRNLILKEIKAVLKIYKTIIKPYIEYCTLNKEIEE